VIKESVLSVGWISEKNTVSIEAGVMKESLLSGGWINEKKV